MDDLNNFELILLRQLSVNYPAVKNHIPFLKVIKRENTGAGMYVDFSYSESFNLEDSFYLPYEEIGTDRNIQMEGLKYGLANIFFISEGKIDSLELSTYGNETWDGTIGDFTIGKQE